MKVILALLLMVGFSACHPQGTTGPGGPIAVGTLEEIAALEITPGNITIAEDGRIFASVHPFRPGKYRLIEVKGNSYEPFPNTEWNRAPGSSANVLNAPLGVEVDSKNRLWVIDTGHISPLQSPKLLAFDIETRKLVYRYDFPLHIAPKGSFPQDFVVDAEAGYVYIADVGLQHAPGLIILNITNNKAFRVDGHESFQPEDTNLRVEGRIITVPDASGKRVPARVGINPITLSSDNQWLFYGAMNGTGWWVIPTETLRNNSGKAKIFNDIERVGMKLVSDGAATDDQENHYFTAINENAIVKLDYQGKLSTLVRDPRLIWPDNLTFGPDGWLYISVNQLNRTSLLNGRDTGVPPYRIMRVWTGTRGVTGR